MAATQRNYAYELQHEVSRVHEKSRAAAQATKKKGLLDRISMFSCIFTCAGVAWLIANTGAKTDSLNYQVYHLQTQINRVTATNAALTAQVDRLSEPSRILQIAESKLHMQYENPVGITGAALGH